MPRPRKRLTKEQAQEVETLAAILTQQQIADYFGINRDTFIEIMKRDTRVSRHYKKGKAKAIGMVAKGLLTRAREGCTTSAIFYLKTQAGWRETQKIDIDGPADGLVKVYLPDNARN